MRIELRGLAKRGCSREASQRVAYSGSRVLVFFGSPASEMCASFLGFVPFDLVFLSPLHYTLSVNARHRERADRSTTKQSNVPPPSGRSQRRRCHYLDTRSTTAGMETTTRSKSPTRLLRLHRVSLVPPPIKLEHRRASPKHHPSQANDPSRPLCPHTMLPRASMSMPCSIPPHPLTSKPRIHGNHNHRHQQAGHTPPPPHSPA